VSDVCVGKGIEAAPSFPDHNTDNTHAHLLETVNSLPAKLSASLPLASVSLCRSIETPLTL
jgi:hypothetical protein